MPSFDVVCRVDLQEVDNAIQQTLREIGQRFDFKNVRTELRREDTTLHLLSGDDFKLRALNGVFHEKLAKRQVPAKALQEGAIEPGRVFDLTLPLAEVAEGYRAMDERRAIKTLLRP